MMAPHGAPGAPASALREKFGKGDERAGGGKFKPLVASLLLFWGSIQWDIQQRNQTSLVVVLISS